MTLVLKPGYSFDSDASTYIDAVETADGQALETGVRIAINDFVLGCKQDEIWDAIKASCILAGARTLDGALVPLVGAAPTNNNFVSGDYDRETGLVGNLTTKYLDSNRNNNADPQNNKHLSVFVSTLPSSSVRPLLGLLANNATGSSFIYDNLTRLNDGSSSSYSRTTGFVGVNRSSSASYARRSSGLDVELAITSATPVNGSITLFRDSGGAGYFGNPRLAFYSIGESLDLALLDTRVSNLITAIGAAIP